MKQFAGIKTVDQLKAECKKRGWEIDTKQHDGGSDHIKFQFEHQGVKTTVFYSAFNGRFFGTTADECAFTSDDAKLDGTPWFDALLDFVYIAEPAVKAA